MKKQHLQHNGLSLNKKLVSNLSSQEVTGGRGTFSCFVDGNTNCGGASGTCQTANECPYSRACDPTEVCL